MCDRLCLPQWVCPFCPMSPFSKRGALPGVRARMGVAPLCAHPLAARAPLLLRVTPLLGEGSPGPRARARTRVSPPGPFVSVWVLPSHGVGAPDPCGCPRVVSLTLSGGGVRVPSVRGRAFCSRDPLLKHRPPVRSHHVLLRACRSWVLSSASSVCGFSFASFREH